MSEQSKIYNLMAIDNFFEKSAIDIGVELLK
jgi:hypothetical protein